MVFVVIDMIRGLGLVDDTKINDPISLLDRVNSVIWGLCSG